MAYSSPRGTQYFVSQTFAAARTLSAVTNANPAVATNTSHGYADDDELLYIGGWGLASNSVYRADQLTTDTFSLKGLNSTSTTRYAAGSGVGTTQKISTWIEIPQVLTINPSGGDLKTITVDPIAAQRAIVLPDGSNPYTIGMTLGDDPTLSTLPTLLDISRSQTLVAYKSVKPNGRATYGYGYFIVTEAATQQNGQADVLNAQFLAQGNLITY
jgi:hypothetical protein